MMENTDLLAASGLFEAGNKLGLAVLGFLALVALVVGSVSAMRKLKEGSGAAITSEIGVIVFAVLIGLSVGIAAALTQEAEDSGIRNPVRVDSVWDR
ncbi:hypothetical protein [Mycobacterium lehmannii]|uniref:hypothetical protein n=1 Tax=Mycobacterium lehmannii TaxID=2048550 RepID=UPI000B943B76|nr:hypothetical protein [Mycobacterium lehmannii]